MLKHVSCLISRGSELKSLGAATANALSTSVFLVLPLYGSNSISLFRRSKYLLGHKMLTKLLIALCQCISIGQFQKYHHTLCFPSKVLHMHCFLIVSWGSNNHSQEKLKVILIQTSVKKTRSIKKAYRKRHIFNYTLKVLIGGGCLFQSGH